MYTHIYIHIHSYTYIHVHIHTYMSEYTIDTQINTYNINITFPQVNGIGVAFEQNSEGVHSVLRLFPG